MNLVNLTLTWHESQVLESNKQRIFSNLIKFWKVDNDHCFVVSPLDLNFIDVIAIQSQSWKIWHFKNHKSYITVRKMSLFTLHTGIFKNSWLPVPNWLKVLISTPGALEGVTWFNLSISPWIDVIFFLPCDKVQCLNTSKLNDSKH